MIAPDTMLEQLAERVAPHATPVGYDRSVQTIVAECAIAAGEDFNELWTKGRIAAGGTRERDSQNFVLGAAYGLAWAMNYLTLDGNGNVTLAVDEEGDALPSGSQPDADSQCDQSADD